LRDNTTMITKHNHLINEKSPYLQQHAHNPVDWYPWGSEAFQEAERRDVPVFLSIGYSTCHWCHVMERESFEDETTAEALNAAFVCVKVDREERPDLDAVYMSACQILTGGGGWPLTIIMTPKKEPFWAGTYLPRTNKRGMLGLMELIPRVSSLWKSDRFRLVSDAASIVEVLSQIPNAANPTTLDENTLNEAYRQLSSTYDEKNSGFGNAPKFPSPHHLMFLLRYRRRTRDPNAIKMVEDTLDAMMRGGIHDQIGGGFHRYSTDAQWLVPHFEKMLYDQATLLLAYTEAHQATVKPIYASIARGIADYTLRNLTSPEGAFYSAEDADSEGEEGKYYTWTLGELMKELNEEEASIAIQAYGVTVQGNIKEKPGENVLHVATSDNETTHESIDPTQQREKLQTIKNKLLKARTGRTKPFLDDKVLTDWNGLMIAALSKAGAALGEENYVKAAEKAADFILKRLYEDELLHRYRLGESAIPAFLDDYAYLTWGLLELYEATFHAEYLGVAKRLTHDAIRHLWDPDLGGFHISRPLESPLPSMMEAYDGSKPSGNSVMAMNLLRLGRVVESSLEVKAEQLFKALASIVGANPVAHTYLLCALDYSIGPSYEVVVAGDPALDDTRHFLDTLHRSYTPNKVLMLKTPSLDDMLYYTSKMSSVDSKPTIYICRDRVCRTPLTDLEEAIRFLSDE
jgi:uncharacterized protein YyaL (SSP411 family)